ncbi:anhydro-N-acetylmuramic acid kinase [Salipiger sp. IMCC34102]|uniref:anhydro-N-acetylmuramic acid kinase n=1 Tax=Salipiger sp. IMCC34102 TaxID=2510647 RepID=UPI00101D6A34|nr:anhydro-N-acetylmuramic acid kinase [Salipiger sp. IMCC34102]RYH03466.1 anhydro-N-acetylmuramic acid kinase [Salipiger sp. IMCC34102]
MKITGPIRALGAMSGTSLDGIDAAVLVTDGERIVDFGPSDYREYSTPERAALRRALGRWPEDDVAEAAAIILKGHDVLLSGFESVDLIGFHGQTLAHDPQGRGTHQVGDGADLAERLGVPVVWDFRSADVRLGGQGAPLAPFYHFALAKWMKATAPLAFLNLGGVGNLTWIDPACDRPEAPGALLAFDTGPANALLDDALMARTGQARDEDGAWAARGTIDDDIVAAFLEHGYFYKIPPKSLDRDTFRTLAEAVTSLGDADAAATLTAATALSVAAALEFCPAPPETVWVCGGGRHNPTMMRMIEASIPVRLRPVEEAGLDGDMLEAQAFAHLAVRVARGLPTSCEGTTGVRAAVSGGTLSRPSGQAARPRAAVR